MKLTFSFALCVLVGTQVWAQVNYPFVMYGGGLDGSTYQQTVIYSNTTYGFLVEAPLNAQGTKLPITFNWRGGGSTFLEFRSGGLGQNVTTLAGQYGAQLKLQEFSGSAFYSFESGAGSNADLRLHYNNAWQSPLMTFKPDGDIGIGTDNPQALVDINGIPALDGTAPVAIRLSAQRGSSDWVPDSKVSGIDFFSSDGSGLGSGVRTSIGMITENAIGSRYGLSFFVSGTEYIEAVRVDSHGNVGIGTIDPSVKLQVDGDIALGYTNALKVNTDWGGAGGANILKTGYDSDRGGDYLDLYVPGNGTHHQTAKISLVENGRLGVGSTSPKEMFQIGDRWTFHAGGHKIIGYNHYYAGGSKRMVEGESAAVRFTDYGDIRLETAASGTVGSKISWINGLTIRNNGNVGIGTTSPGERLHVKDGRSLLQNTSGTVPLAVWDTDGDSKIQIGANTNGTVKYRYIGTATNGDFNIYQNNGSTVHVTVDNQGNMGIGTTDPTSKLTVDGDIMATKVKVVTDVASVPDYVFADDYELSSLEEVEAYVKENSHLPEVPSAAEMAASGQDLGEMNLLLLKKIEELTLHLIQQNDRLERLEEENQGLSQRLKVHETQTTNKR